jgi:hypothetical protein
VRTLPKPSSQAKRVLGIYPPGEIARHRKPSSPLNSGAAEIVLSLLNTSSGTVADWRGRQQSGLLEIE